MAEDEQEIEVTLKVKVSAMALFFKVYQAEVEEGPFKGTTYCTNVGGGAPIVTVHKDGKDIGTAWIGLQELLGTMIEAVEKAAITGGAS